jgi:hypothetical protein
VDCFFKRYERSVFGGTKAEPIGIFGGDYGKKIFEDGYRTKAGPLVKERQG